MGDIDLALCHVDPLCQQSDVPLVIDLKGENANKTKTEKIFYPNTKINQAKTTQRQSKGKSKTKTIWKRSHLDESTHLPPLLSVTSTEISIQGRILQWFFDTQKVTWFVDSMLSPVIENNVWCPNFVPRQPSVCYVVVPFIQYKVIWLNSQLKTEHYGLTCDYKMNRST